MERQMKHLMMAKWNTHQETAEIHPDTDKMPSAVEHQKFPRSFGNHCCACGREGKEETIF
jgi:hypothetical protein